MIGNDMRDPGAGPRPNVFVVGDAKCGTTSLHRLFELCSEIGTARTRKELHFFSEPEIMSRVAGPGDADIPGAIIHNSEEYLDEHAHLDLGLRVIADVSPSYLQTPAAAERIHAFAPDGRIVILLREPASKVYSQYVHLWGEGREDLSFEDAWEKSGERRAAGWSDMFDYQSGGFYAGAVRRYFDLFGRNQVLVLFFEELTADMDAARARLEGFLGVTLPEGDLPRMNTGGRISSPVLGRILGNEQIKSALRTVLPLSLRTRIAGRVQTAVATEKPRLSDEMRIRMQTRFAADVAELEGLLGKTTGWLPG